MRLQISAFRYDQVGNVIARTDWTGSATNAYDGLGRATHQWTQYTTPVSASYAIDNTFDLANNRLRADYSVNGGTAETVTNAFDSLDRVVCVQHLNSGAGAGYAYDDNGKPGTMAYRMNSSSVATRSLAYDGEQRLASLNVAQSQNNYLALGYVYNSAQQITQINERATIESTLLTTNRFSYDDRDQLVGEHRISDATSYQPLVEYAYDHAQNRLSRMAKGVSGSTDDYAYAMANILTNITIGSPQANNQYSYDIAGNLATSVVNGAVAVFRYNAQNKLVRIEGEGFTNDFVYDSGNRRIAIRQNTDAYRIDIHDGSVCIASFVNGILGKFFVRGAGIAEGTGDIIAEVAMPYGSTHFYVANHRGDTVMTLDNKWYGCIPECYLQYDAFGNPEPLTPNPSFTPRFTFSTKEYLSEAKLYLYAYRVYDPQAGRWTQRDPIDYQDSVNLYQFCGSNPINNVDPLGKDGCTILFFSFYYNENGNSQTEKKATRNHEASHRRDFWNGKQFTEPRWKQEQRAWQEDVKVYQDALKDPNLPPADRTKLERELKTAQFMTTEKGARMYTGETKTSRDIQNTPKQQEHSSKNPANMNVSGVVDPYTGTLYETPKKRTKP